MNPENLQSLKNTLTAIQPGTSFQVDWFLAAEFSDDEVTQLISDGATWEGGGARLKKMAQSNCHMNAIMLAMKNKGWSVGTGLALSPDGVWRVHSWCINTRGRIVETTMPRDLYFGLALSPADAAQRMLAAIKRLTPAPPSGTSTP